MQGTTLWIVLGALVTVVIIFLIVASVLDRKKAKKIKAEKARIEKAAESSVAKVAIWINLTIEKNRSAIKNFVPSVGKIKMKDIKEKAIKSLKLLVKSEEYNLACHSQEEPKVAEMTNALLKTNSTVWETTAKESVEFFKRIEKETELKETHKLFKKEAQAKIKEIY